MSFDAVRQSEQARRGAAATSRAGPSALANALLAYKSPGEAIELLQQVTAILQQARRVSQQKRSGRRRNEAGSSSPAAANASNAWWPSEAYEELWQNVLMQAPAVGNGTPAAPPPSGPCPKVFIYNLSGAQTDFDPSSASIDRVFGKVAAAPGALREHVRLSYQYSFAEALLYRLWRSRCRTRVAEEADLFLAPILPKAKQVKRTLVPKCKRIAHVDWDEALPHLDESTRSRHFVVFAHEHVDEHAACGGWFSHPRGHLRGAVRVSYSHLLPPHTLKHDYLHSKVCGLGDGVSCYHASNLTEAMYPRLISVPLLSSIHWSAAAASRDLPPPWANDSPRRHLMLFLGRLTYKTKHGMERHGDADAREEVARQCAAINDPAVCKMEAFTPKALLHKQSSTFCLEPAGDTPSRKSIGDSVALGCIPVFFNEMTDALFSSWVYPNTATLSRVLVPREPFLARQVSLKALLESVPPPLLGSMRRAVALNARHLQLSLDDDPHDMLPWLLHRVRTYGGEGGGGT